MKQIGADLERKIKTGKAKIAVLGLGYVGLPLALAFAEEGFACFGIDADRSKVKKLNAGKSYIPDIPSRQIKAQVKKGALIPTDNFAKLSIADAILVCVPTPLSKSKDPDFSFVLNAVDAVGPRLKPGQMVVIESTIYPGMTVELIGPRLENQSGLKAGKDFFLAMSPERIDPGNKKHTLRNTPKVVGGIDRASTILAGLLYQQIINRVVPVSSPTVAEMAKLLENTFRQINIGLVNEIAIICDKLGINVLEVIDASSTKPFGFMSFYPGPGIGGHCIPVDPIYLSWKMKSLNYRARFIELATDINAEMPRFWVDKIQQGLNNRNKSLKDAVVLIMGVTYKKDIDDLRESPVLEIMHLLIEAGADLRYHDPFVPVMEVDDRKFKSAKFSRELIRSADCVVIATDHSQIDYGLVKKEAKLIIDTRGVYYRLGKRTLT